MRVVSASARLGVAYESSVPPEVICRDAPLGPEIMAIDYAVSAAKDTLDRARLKGSELDLVITASVSPDHLADHPDIMGPRLCHPLQRELGADRAFVFDLQDGCWVSLMDMANTLLLGMGLSKALVVKADCFPGLDLAEAGELGWGDGAGAMLIEPSSVAQFPPRYQAIEGSGAPARIETLPPMRRFRGKQRAALNFSAHPDLKGALSRAFRRLHDFFPDNWQPFVEPWPWTQSRPARGPHWAPYALPMALRENESRFAWTGIVSFDPFRMRAGACQLGFA